MEKTKKTIVKGNGSSFRAAGKVSTSLTVGPFAFLDNVLDPVTGSHKGGMFTHFGAAGANYAAICMVHISGNYYGGIVFSYDGSLVKFNKQEGVCYIDHISSN